MSNTSLTKKIALPVLGNSPARAGSPVKQSLIELLLAEQQHLTAVEQFSQAFDRGEVPAREKHYQKLLPSTPPGKGQQYAFEVDLDKCSGCKACVVACHNLNGLDDKEAWRDVGLLVGGTASVPLVQHVTTACHHCLEPACMIGCPVNAYEKDPVTGIVKHLDDQCFGCQYCILACPYDVPKYNPNKGIVRKCDMCSSRLSVGEAPACVQSCPTQAISIRVVNIDNVIEDAEAAQFIPAAPDPQITYPTTTYKTKRVMPRNMLPADYFQVSTQHPHWPLVIMLVLTQLSVGAFAWGVGLERVINAEMHELAADARPIQAAMALAFGLLALGASIFHLGRPQYAFRAFLGLRHSWLSREIVAFGLFAGLACLHAGTLVLPDALPLSDKLVGAIGWSVVVVGAVAVFCSVMIYASVHRDLWDFQRTTCRFVLTSASLGLATIWLSLPLIALIWPSEASMALLAGTGPMICWTLLIVNCAKLLWEAMLVTHLFSRSMTSMKRSALLMVHNLANQSFARFALGMLGGVFAPALLLQIFAAGTIESRQLEITVLTLLLFSGSVAGELMERYLYFAMVASPRMPGGIR